jgi:hypothetical protein
MAPSEARAREGALEDMSCWLHDLYVEGRDEPLPGSLRHLPKVLRDQLREERAKVSRMTAEDRRKARRESGHPWAAIQARKSAAEGRTPREKRQRRLDAVKEISDA